MTARPSRRWPAALAAIGVALAVGLTSWLVSEDRANRAAATSSPANAARDAVAVTGLRRISSTLALASALSRDGIDGLRSIGLEAYQAHVVTALGGTLSQDESGWTLALGGGWACLQWVRSTDGSRWTTVVRGVCPGAPILSSPVIGTGDLRDALGAAARDERAAFDAAFATDVVARGLGSIDLADVVHQLRQHEPLPFSWNLNEYGLTVMTDASAACVHQVAPSRTVTVEDGACP